MSAWNGPSTMFGYLGLGIEILVDKFSLATTAELRIRANLLVDVGFRYALAFCASSDSGSQLRSSSR